MRRWGSSLLLGMIAALAATTAPQVARGGLVGYWPFEEGSGTTTADASGSGYTGAMIGDTAFTTDAARGAYGMAFGGTSGYVDMPDGFADFTGGFTVSAWVKTAAYTNWARVIDFGNGAGVDNVLLARRDTSNNLRFEVHDGIAPGGTQLNRDGVFQQDQWQHFVATISPSRTAAVYLDGTPIVSGTMTLPRNVTRTNNYIGESNWGGDAFFQGVMDDVAIWDHALRAEDVQALQAGTAPTDIPSRQPLPPPYVGEDIGTTGGTSYLIDDQLFVVGDGNDIWNNADQFHYVHAPSDVLVPDSSGDFNVIVRLVSQDRRDGWSKAGIMARETTDAGSVQVNVSATPDNGIGLQWRDTTDGGSGWAGSRMTDSPNSAAAPFWLSLSRRGDTFSATWAPDVDGQPGWWSQSVQQHTSGNMPSAVELGLHSTSHSSGNYSAAVFDNTVVGNWEAVAELQRGSGQQWGSVLGRAYARDRDTGAMIGPAHWKLERLTYDTVPGMVQSEWYLGHQFGSQADFELLPTRGWGHEDYLLPGISWSNGNNYPPETPYTGDMSNYCVRMFGEIFAPVDGTNTYRFHDHNDDWAVLIIDGQTVISDGSWTNLDGTQGSGGAVGSIDLGQGWHSFEFGMSEGGGGDNARLLWDIADAGLHPDNFLDVASEYFRVRTLVDVELLAESYGNVGSPASLGSFAWLDKPEPYDLKLTVEFGPETGTAFGEFVGVPEPATCLLLGGGIVALLRRRLRR